jgi:hypothetical protein
MLRACLADRRNLLFVLPVISTPSDIMKHPYRHYVYSQPLDLTGEDLIGLGRATRRAVKKVIPCLVAPSKMAAATGFKKYLLSMTGELADEVHEFENATQGSFRLQKILLKEGTVLELVMAW